MYHFRVKPLVGFAVLYGMMYSAFGVASPFWPMFFEARGLSSRQLGTLLAWARWPAWSQGQPSAV